MPPELRGTGPIRYPVPYLNVSYDIFRSNWNYSTAVDMAVRRRKVLTVVTRGVGSGTYKGGGDPSSICRLNPVDRSSLHPVCVAYLHPYLTSCLVHSNDDRLLVSSPYGVGSCGCPRSPCCQRFYRAVEAAVHSQLRGLARWLLLFVVE